MVVGLTEDGGSALLCVFAFDGIEVLSAAKEAIWPGESGSAVWEAAGCTRSVCARAGRVTRLSANNGSERNDRKGARLRALAKSTPRKIRVFASTRAKAKTSMLRTYQRRMHPQ